MIRKSIADELEKIEFIKRAAEKFKDISISTYSDKTPSPGCLFAVRWGLMDDCVLVFKLSDECPEIFAQVIQKS